MSIHETRYRQLLERDETNDADIERQSLFYIVSGNDDLYEKRDYIYDFQEKAIRTDCLEGTVDFSSGSQRLVKLAFNLYNGYSADVYDTFSALDKDNAELAREAISLRFRIGY